MSIPLEITLDRAGRTPYRLTDNLSSLKFSTAAMGGFSSCSFTLPGPPPFWKREVPHLGMLRVVLDTFVIWEGRVEDVSLSLKDETTTVTCIGLQRLLDDVSVRRIWSKRDLNLEQTGGGLGALIPLAVAGDIAQADLNVSIDNGGVTIAGNGVSVGASAGCLARAYYPGSTIYSVNGTITISGTNTGSGKMSARLFAFDQGGATLRTGDFFTSQATFTYTPAEPHEAIGFGFYNNGVGAITPTANDLISYTQLRILGTTLTEDAVGGFMGGTILRDLIALVPGLSIGIIDSGSDFTIQSIERNVRSAARSVVEEVAGYYTREWRVWEDGRFDWKAVNADEPQWIATVADLSSGSELTTTVDGLAATVYLLYADAASGLDTEASATTISQRNPFIKQGKTSDVLASPGFPMTSSSASQLASRLVTDGGAYPLVQGRLVLPATSVIKRASGSPLPAFMIRAGDNIVVADLPKTDLFQQGRDGETLFHIVSTEATLDDGTMVLEVEGQTNRTDVLLARLAAATRTLTG